jgi:hypothetical protein
VRKRQPFYDESTLHADTEACFDVLSESELGFVHQVLTYTRRHKAAVTKYASWLGTYRPSQISTHVRYGHTYLSQEEYERRLAAMVVDYWRFLLTRSPRLRDERFRTFHRKVLRDLRNRVHAGEVARGTVRQLRRLLGRKRRRASSRFDGQGPDTQR